MLNPHRHSRMQALSMSLLRPTCHADGDRDHDQKVSVELDVSQGGGRGPEETSLGIQKKHPRDVSLDKIEK